MQGIVYSQESEKWWLLKIQKIGCFNNKPLKAQMKTLMFLKSMTGYLKKTYQERNPLWDTSIFLFQSLITSLQKTYKVVVNHENCLMVRGGMSYLLSCLQADSQSSTTGSTDWRLYQQTVSTDGYWCSLYLFFFFSFESDTFMDNHLSELWVQGLPWKSNVILEWTDERILRGKLSCLCSRHCVCQGHSTQGYWCPIQMSGEGELIEDLSQCWILCSTLLKWDLHTFLSLHSTLGKNPVICYNKY